jgi:hypothetical protein
MLVALALAVLPFLGKADDTSGNGFDRAIRRNHASLFKEGRHVFRYATFGDEAFWGDALKLHLALAGQNNGGVGPGVSPRTALSAGLKVDVEALPHSLQAKLRAGKVNLDDPATTLALLKLKSVVGVTGFFDPARGGTGRIKSIGIQCALCHSTVDDSFAPGIGRRLDGWPNRDLNVGAIINLAPDVSPFTAALQVDEATVRTVLNSWGPGKFDAALLSDKEKNAQDAKEWTIKSKVWLEAEAVVRGFV